MQIKTKIVSCHTADSKPVKQEVNGTMIPLPLVFPEVSLQLRTDDAWLFGQLAISVTIKLLKLLTHRSKI